MVKRYLSLDVGEKRIGIAISDPTASVSLPLQVLNRTSLEKDLRIIGDIIDQYEIKTLVVGYPLSLSGEKSDQTRVVEEFVKKLEKALSIETILWDERLTTAQAAKDLTMTGKKAKKKIDAIAASLILQNYIESKSSK